MSLQTEYVPKAIKSLGMNKGIGTALLLRKRKDNTYLG